MGVSAVPKHECDLPDPATFDPSAVVMCDECHVKWVRNGTILGPLFGPKWKGFDYAW